MKASGWLSSNQILSCQAISDIIFMSWYFANEIEDYGFVGLLIVKLHELIGQEEFFCRNNFYMMNISMYKDFLEIQVFLLNIIYGKKILKPISLIYVYHSGSG